MSVYMIVPTEDSERLERVVLKIFPTERDRYVLPNKAACFVRYDGTSAELTSLLDLEGNQNKEDRPCPAVIMAVTTYGGFAPTSLWEWLRNARKEN